MHPRDERSYMVTEGERQPMHLVQQRGLCSYDVCRGGRVVTLRRIAQTSCDERRGVPTSYVHNPTTESVRTMSIHCGGRGREAVNLDNGLRRLISSRLRLPIGQLEAGLSLPDRLCTGFSKKSPIMLLESFSLSRTVQAHNISEPESTPLRCTLRRTVRTKHAHHIHL